MAKGKDPKPGLSVWSTVWATMKGMGGAAFKKRRA